MAFLFCLSQPFCPLSRAVAQPQSDLTHFHSHTTSYVLFLPTENSEKFRKKNYYFGIIIRLGFCEFISIMTLFADTNKRLFLTKGMDVSFYLWIDLYCCYSLMQATLWYELLSDASYSLTWATLWCIYKRLPYENMSRAWIFVSMAEAIFNLTLPVGQGTRPTGNGEIENSLSHTHKNSLACRPRLVHGSSMWGAEGPSNTG